MCRQRFTPQEESVLYLAMAPKGPSRVNTVDLNSPFDQPAGAGLAAVYGVREVVPHMYMI